MLLLILNCLGLCNVTYAQDYKYHKVQVEVEACEFYHVKYSGIKFDRYSAIKVGYLVDKNLFIGLGVGVARKTQLINGGPGGLNPNRIPIMASVKYSWPLCKVISYLVATDIGYNCLIDQRYRHFEKEVFAYPKMGFGFRVYRKCSINTYIAYQFNENVSGSNSLGLCLGISF